MEVVEVEWWSMLNFEAATPKFCNCSWKFGSSPLKGKVDLCMTKGSKVLIYLTLLGFIFYCTHVSNAKSITVQSQFRLSSWDWNHGKFTNRKVWIITINVMPFKIISIIHNWTIFTIITIRTTNIPICPSQRISITVIIPLVCGTRIHNTEPVATRVQVVIVRMIILLIKPRISLSLIKPTHTGNALARVQQVH